MSILRLQKDATVDVATQLKDAGAVGSSAAAQVGGEARVLELGAARVDARLRVDASAVKATASDQLYQIEAQFSNDDFTGIAIGGVIKLGHATATGAASGPNNAPGRFEIGVSNEINGVIYSQMRLFTRVAGTDTPSVNYSAWLVKPTV